MKTEQDIQRDKEIAMYMLKCMLEPIVKGVAFWGTIWMVCQILDKVI